MARFVSVTLIGIWPCDLPERMRPVAGIRGLERDVGAGMREADDEDRALGLSWAGLR